MTFEQRTRNLRNLRRPTTDDLKKLEQRVARLERQAGNKEYAKMESTIKSTFKNIKQMESKKKDSEIDGNTAMAFEGLEDHVKSVLSELKSLFEAFDEVEKGLK